MSDVECRLDLIDVERHLIELEDHFDELTEVGPNIFSILGIDTRERRLTRFLAWMLDPSAGHNGGREFLDSFLDVSGTRLDTEVTVDRLVPITIEDNDDDAEIDVVLIGEFSVIGIEIKTTHQGSEEKLHKEAEALPKKYPGYDSYDLVYLTYFGDEIPETTYPYVFWSDLVERFEIDRSSVPTEYEKQLITDFTTTIRIHIMTEFDGISKKGELYLENRDVIDPVSNAYDNDKDQAFDALETTYFTESNCSRDDWTVANRSENFIKFFKDTWRGVAGGVNIEYEPHVRLRLDDPEIRLRLDVERGDKQEVREKIRERLGDEGERALAEADWKFTGGSSSFIAKSVPLELHDNAQESIHRAIRELHELREIVEPHVDAIVAEYAKG